MDQPAARQPAHRHRRRDGALCPRGAGARWRPGLHARADHRPEPGQRRPPDGHGVPARGWAGAAPSLAREEDPRRDRLRRAARGAPGGRSSSARGGRPTLMGDRFYGSPALIAWCREQDWGWRLRLKQDLLVFEAGGETTLVECFARGEHLLRDIELTEQRVRTNVAMVHEAGHPEPWIIALSQTPSVHTAFDYGLRWGIEAMFSDFKTRGFNLEDSQIARTDRLDRLVLVLALALHWAVSTGMWDAVENRTPAEKN